MRWCTCEKKVNSTLPFILLKVRNYAIIPYAFYEWASCRGLHDIESGVLGETVMKKRWKVILAAACYIFGVFASIYIGGWLMLVKPVRLLMYAYGTGTLSVKLLAVCVLKIVLSTTVAGLVWCVGYIGCNYFRGTEDEYDRLIEQEMKRRRERHEQRKKVELYNKESGAEG